MLRKAKIMQSPSHGYALNFPLPFYDWHHSRTRRRTMNFQENDLSTENMTATMG